jgi:non-ribosomal peptide synthetase component E (peptide arylation enzyme)
MGALGRAEETDKPAIVVGDDITTYRELEERTNRLAHVLIELGVEPLDRVAVMLPNGAELLESGLTARCSSTSSASSAGPARRSSRGSRRAT